MVANPAIWTKCWPWGSKKGAREETDVLKRRWDSGDRESRKEYEDSMRSLMSEG
jgi:hypothetical protein